MKKLILMQGAPGCGKSTMADLLAKSYRLQETPSDSIFNRLHVVVRSADQYWYEVNEPDQPNKYSWNPELSGKNHKWNQFKVLDDMQNGFHVIIVDNTNTTRKEARPYVVLAEMFDYEVEVVRVDPGLDVCIARQADRPEDRRVPEEVIRSMHGRMESLLD